MTNRKRRFGPGAAVGAILMVAILIGMADEMEEEAREVFRPLTSGTGETIEGQGRVIDGDTLEIAGSRVRLIGIDAVEKDQLCKDRSGDEWPCGRYAAEELARLVNGKSVMCLVKEYDRYGRAVADCETGALSLSYWVVQQGWAIATDFSRDYVNAESEARAEGRGIFAGDFIAPKQWRTLQSGH